MSMILNPGSNIVPNFLNFDYHLIRRLLIQLDKQDMKPVGLEENIKSVTFIRPFIWLQIYLVLRYPPMQPDQTDVETCYQPS